MEYTCFFVEIGNLNLVARETILLLIKDNSNFDIFRRYPTIVAESVRKTFLWFGQNLVFLHDKLKERLFSPSLKEREKAAPKSLYTYGIKMKTRKDQR